MVILSTCTCQRYWQSSNEMVPKASRQFSPMPLYRCALYNCIALGSTLCGPPGYEVGQQPTGKIICVGVTNIPIATPAVFVHTYQPQWNESKGMNGVLEVWSSRCRKQFAEEPCETQVMDGKGCFEGTPVGWHEIYGCQKWKGYLGGDTVCLVFAMGWLCLARFDKNRYRLATSRMKVADLSFHPEHPPKDDRQRPRNLVVAGRPQTGQSPTTILFDVLFQIFYHPRAWNGGKQQQPTMGSRWGQHTWSPRTRDASTVYHTNWIQYLASTREMVAPVDDHSIDPGSSTAGIDNLIRTPRQGSYKLTEIDVVLWFPLATICSGCGGLPFWRIWSRPTAWRLDARNYASLFNTFGAQYTSQPSIIGKKFCYAPWGIWTAEQPFQIWWKKLCTFLWIIDINLPPQTTMAIQEYTRPPSWMRSISWAPKTCQIHLKYYNTSWNYTAYIRKQIPTWSTTKKVRLSSTIGMHT